MAAGNLHSKKSSDFKKIVERACDGYKKLQHESDRGSALVGGAILEETLGALLKAFFVQDQAVIDELMTASNAPASSFSARTRLCRAIGLISDETFRDLERVRAIRNQAAHFDRRGDRGHEFSFFAQDVSDRIRSFSFITKDAWRDLPPRILFEAFVMVVASVLTERAIIAHTVVKKADRDAAIRILLARAHDTSLYEAIEGVVETLKKMTFKNV